MATTKQVNPEEVRTKLVFLIQQGIVGLDQINNALNFLNEYTEAFNAVLQQRDMANKQVQELLDTLPSVPEPEAEKDDGIPAT